MDVGFERIDSRLLRIEARLEKHDDRLLRIEARLEKHDGRFDKHDGRFNQILAGQKTILEKLEKQERNPLYTTDH